MSCTINEKNKWCELSHAKLSKAFWDEALTTIMNLINIYPFVPLNGDLPKTI